jgi:hypothetical protein
VIGHLIARELRLLKKTGVFPAFEESRKNFCHSCESITCYVTTGFFVGIMCNIWQTAVLLNAGAHGKKYRCSTWPGFELIFEPVMLKNLNVVFTIRQFLCNTFFRFNTTAISSNRNLIMIHKKEH